MVQKGTGRDDRRRVRGMGQAEPRGREVREAGGRWQGGVGGRKTREGTQGLKNGEKNKNKNKTKNRIKQVETCPRCMQAN